eukprot:scaffold136527_cov19-Tisochrysis_lutea.AAC.4
MRWLPQSSCSTLRRCQWGSNCQCNFWQQMKGAWENDVGEQEQFAILERSELTDKQLAGKMRLQARFYTEAAHTGKTCFSGASQYNQGSHLQRRNSNGSS